MDPFVALDCDNVLPNRFALVLAATARSRALNHGAEPRSVLPTTSELALNEIAEGCFTPAELEPFLGWPKAALQPPLPALELRGSEVCTSASAPASPITRFGEAVIDDACNPNRRSNDAKVTVLQ